MRSLLFLSLLITQNACGEKGESPNRPPIVKLDAEMIGTDPFSFRFTADATDQDLDSLTYEWDFGNGSARNGLETETSNYDADKVYSVKVTVRDNRSGSSTATISIDTKTTTIRYNTTQQFQTMTGFGGFGAQDVYWSNGPFTSDRFVNDIVNDLGVTIIRDELPTSLELVNDNNDPKILNLAGYNLNTEAEGHHKPLGARIPHLKAMKAAGVKTFIASVWSPAPWMKYNNDVDNGTPDNSAPPYTNNPTATTNQLKTENFEEFAELCVAYIKLLKREADIDLYALSVQNEPRFSQYYQSCVYDGAALRELIRVVGKRFKEEQIQTKLFLPEDIGWIEGVLGMVKPTLDDPETRQYAGIIAVHGYEFDGATANSPGAQAWNTMYSWGGQYNKPLWMTETSGFANTYPGAMSLAKAMYTAIRYGNVSAWVFWTLSTATLNEYSLISSSGQKSKRYFVSKNFYRYVRPGAVRFAADAPENSSVLPLAFRNDPEGTTTLVLINENNTGKPVRISGDDLPAQYRMFVTSAIDDCKDYGLTAKEKVILLPAGSVVTLVSE